MEEEVIEQEKSLTLKSLEKQMKENCKNFSAEIDSIKRDIEILKKVIKK